MEEDVVLKKQTLAELVGETLLRDIVNGDFSGEERLTEEGLCRRYGISRTPVRDALNRLEKTGLIERALPRGYRLKRLSPGEVRDLFAARRLVEQAMLDELMTSLPVAELQELLRRLDATDGHAAALAIDDEIHRLLQENCSNTFLRDFHRRLLLLSMPYRDFRNLPGVGPGEVEIRAERRKLLKAILAGEHEAASQLLDQHLDAGCGDIITAMEKKKHD